MIAAADPRRVTAAALVSMVAAIAPMHLVGALAPEIQDELGFGDAAQGIAIGVFFGASALVSSWGGALTDRIGPSPALRAAAVASAAGSAVLLVTPGYGILVVGLLIASLGNAISQPGNNTFISGGVPVRRRGVALGIKQAAIPTSTALAGLALPAVAATLGWRWAYGFAVILALVALAVIPAVEPPVPRVAKGTRFRPSRPLVLVAVGAGFAAAGVASIGAFLVRSATDAGFSDTAAGLLQVVGSITLISTRVGWGWLMDRHPLDRWRFAAALLAVGAMGFPLLASGNHGAMIVGAVLAFGAGWSWPGVVHLGTVETNPDATGAASGMVQAGIFAGATVGPALFGVLADQHGFRWAWMLSFSFAATASALIAFGAARQRTLLRSASRAR